MLLWAKVAAVLGFSVMLMGSKIIIHVPPGGSVVSSSGLFACAAGEVCTIDINEQYFAETFTAEAEPGFEFGGWGDKAGTLCGGSRDPYCSELGGDSFSDFGSGKPQLQPGSVLTMHPSFAATGYAAPQPDTTSTTVADWLSGAARSSVFRTVTAGSARTFAENITSTTS